MTAALPSLYVVDATKFRSKDRSCTTPRTLPLRSTDVPRRKLKLPVDLFCSRLVSDPPYHVFYLALPPGRLPMRLSVCQIPQAERAVPRSAAETHPPFAAGTSHAELGRPPLRHARGARATPLGVSRRLVLQPLVRGEYVVDSLVGPEGGEVLERKG